MTHKIGDIVTPNPDAGWARRMIGTLYVVTTLPRGANGVNYKAAPCDASGTQVPGQGLRSPAWAIIAPTDAASVTVETYVPNPAAGTIVKSDGPQIPRGVYVVIGETDATRVRIVAVGDTSGRYYRAPSKVLTVLDGAADALNDLL